MAGLTRRLLFISAAIFVGLLAADHPRESISYTEAQATVHDLAEREMAFSEKDFGTTYSPEYRKRIHDRLWDTAQTMLSEVYNFKESRHAR
jgi:hypothetical protein